MNETLDNPSGTREGQRKRPTPLLPGGPQNKSIPIGIIATILLHLILFLGTPGSFQSPYKQPDKTLDDIQIDLTPEEQTPQEQLKFVETNPDAPVNKPDKTQNFAAQDQQAAQEKPTDEHSDTPKTEGKDIPSTAIVTGQKAEPMESANSGQPTPPTQPAQETQVNPNQPQALKPLPNFEEFTGDDPDGMSAKIAKDAQNPQPVDKEVEGQDTPTDNQVVMATPPTSPGRPMPRPRPKLQNTRPAPLANQPKSASQNGAIGVDANFSEFGDYLQELIEVVQAEWDRILSSASSRPPSDSHVQVTFILTAQGDVQVVDVQEGTAGRFGTDACLAAIRNRLPYRPWTKEMVAVLGQQQEIRFNFYYW